MTDNAGKIIAGKVVHLLIGSLGADPLDGARLSMHESD